MNRTLRTAVGFLLVVALIVAGFASGKAIGSRLRSQPDSTLTPWIPGSGALIDNRSEPNAPPNEVFASVLDKVQQDYVGSAGAVKVSNARLSQGALSRMISSLQDPHTIYLSPSQAELRVNAILGRRFGIGAELTIVTTQSKPGDLNSSFLTVKSVAPGSPAERAGLHTGDRVTEVNGLWVIAYSVTSDSSHISASTPDSSNDESKHESASQIQSGITAERVIRNLATGAGKTLHLTVYDASQTKTPRHVDVTTSQTELPAVIHRTVGSGVAYLRIAEFTSDAAAGIDAALSNRHAWEHGLIIDLRQCAGGVAAERGSRIDGYRCALDLVGYVSLKPEAGQLERKAGERAPINVPKTRQVSSKNVRVAVLIDGGTSNLAELAAADMRDTGGAKLIGSKTFGDDVLPYLSVFNDGGAIELTTAHLFTVSGVDLSKGVNPDISVKAANLGGGNADLALQEAIRCVSEQ